MLSFELLIAELGIGEGIGEGSEGLGVGRVQDISRHKFGQEFLGQFLVQKLNRLVNVCQNETIHAYHDGGPNLCILRDLIGLKRGIHRFLHILHIDLQPSHITGSYGILLIIPDVQRRA